MNTENRPLCCRNTPRIQERAFIMNKNMQQYDDDMFKTIDEFKYVLSCGGEIEFIWKGTKYGAFGCVCENEDGPERILVCEGFYEKDGKYYNQSSHKEVVPEETDFWCDTPDGTFGATLPTRRSNTLSVVTDSVM